MGKKKRTHKGSKQKELTISLITALICLISAILNMISMLIEKLK